MNGENRKHFEDSSSVDSGYSTHQKRHSKDFEKVRKPSSPITRSLQAAYLGTKQTASNEQTSEKRRSSNKRTRNSSRHSNKLKQTSKLKINQGNNKSGKSFAKNDNSILNYRTKKKVVDVRNIKISRSSPTQPSKVFSKNEKNKIGVNLKRQGKEDYVGVTKPAFMFVTSSKWNTSLTKLKASDKIQNNNKKNKFSSGESSPSNGRSRFMKGIHTHVNNWVYQLSKTIINLLI